MFEINRFVETGEFFNVVPKDALGMKLSNFVDLLASIPPENFSQFFVKQTDVDINFGHMTIYEMWQSKPFSTVNMEL